MQIYTKKYKIHDRRKLLSGLSLLEKSVFYELEDEYLLLYPKGLKGDLASLYRICSAIGRREKDAVKSVVEMFYTLVDGRYMCQLLDAQAEDTITKSNKQRDRRNSSKSTNTCSTYDTQKCSTEASKLLENNDSQITAVDSTLNSYTSKEVLKEREIGKPISLKKTPKQKRDWKIDERFLRFREAYPIRPGDSPGAAYDVFLKVVETEGVDHEKIIDGARRYAASRVGESEKFTKHACHWLSPHYRGWELDWTPAKQAIGGKSPGAQSFGDAFIGSIRALGSSFDGSERDFEPMRTVN